MRLTYASSRLSTRCSNFDRMRREWGVDVATALARRIKQLEAATSPDDLLLLPGRWEWLRGVRSHEMSARLTPNWRLIVEPLDDKSVKVVRIEDYH